MFSQVGGDGDVISHNQVAKLSFFFIDRESFSFQTDFGAVLDFGFHFQLNFSVQSVYGFFTAQHGCIKIEWGSDIEVIA